jgi:hypothetical protein
VTISSRTKAILAAAVDTSRAVRLLVGVELVVMLGIGLAAADAAASAVGRMAANELPPWRVLAILPIAGAAAELVRAARPLDVLRRWHGVVLRRVDERWGDER